MKYTELVLQNLITCDSLLPRLMSGKLRVK